MNVDLARIQFAFTSINHFFFVPVTIGLAFLTALLQAAWYRAKQEEYLRPTRFFGAPLAMEGLSALFLESVFLGLWLLDHGRVAKQGSHDELRHAGGPYQRMRENDHESDQPDTDRRRPGRFFYLHSGDETRPVRRCNGVGRRAETQWARW